MVLSRRSRGRLGGLRRPRPELRGQDAEAPEGGTLAAAARTLRRVPVHHRSQRRFVRVVHAASEASVDPNTNTAAGKIAKSEFEPESIARLSLTRRLPRVQQHQQPPPTASDPLDILWRPSGLAAAATARQTRCTANTTVYRSAPISGTSAIIDENAQLEPAERGRGAGGQGHRGERAGRGAEAARDGRSRGRRQAPQAPREHFQCEQKFGACAAQHR